MNLCYQTGYKYCNKYYKASFVVCLQASWLPTTSSLSRLLSLWAVSWCTTGDRGRKEPSPPSWAGTQVKMNPVPNRVSYCNGLYDVVTHDVSYSQYVKYSSLLR